MDPNGQHEHSESAANVASLRSAPAKPSPAADQQSGPPGRVDVTIDDENYEAGSGNIIVITLRNPFEVPISIIDLTDPKATGIRQSRKSISTDGTKKPSGFWDAVMSGFTESAATASIKFGGIKAQFGTSNRTLQVNSEGDATIDVGDVVSKFDSIEINAKGNAKIIAPTSDGGESVVRIVQPHCETNASLTIHTKGWVFAKPTRLRLKSELRYRIDGDTREYTQVVPLNFDVRPPLRSVVIGSVFGAILGGAVRFINDTVKSNSDVLSLTIQDWVLQAIRISGSIIMAIIASIALSRKTGAQGFITVEDFFGGFVVGVLVAYEGASYFEDILKSQGGAGKPQINSVPGHS